MSHWGLGFWGLFLGLCFLYKLSKLLRRATKVSQGVCVAVCVSMEIKEVRAATVAALDMCACVCVSLCLCVGQAAC